MEEIGGAECTHFCFIFARPVVVMSIRGARLPEVCTLGNKEVLEDPQQGMAASFQGLFY